MALDEPCAKILREIFGDSIDILPQNKLLETDPDLASMRGSRKNWPFYATHKPVLLLATLLSEPPGARLVKYGHFNAGCVWFRNDRIALRCIADWRAQRLEWCDEEPTALNSWPAHYPRVPREGSAREVTIGPNAVRVFYNPPLESG